MFLSNFSIKQPVTTIAIVIVLMCLGLLALKNLRVNQIPDVENPVMSISFPYPGASPETVEREIINRVEKPLQSIPQVYEIWSNASESSANFTIIFDFKKDMSEAGDEIRNAIRLGALQAAHRDARAGAVATRSGVGSHRQPGTLIDQTIACRDFPVCGGRARRSAARHRRRVGSQCRRRPASRAFRAAARAEDARVQRLGR
jgi:hypothetical protein